MFGARREICDWRSARRSRNCSLVALKSVASCRSALRPEKSNSSRDSTSYTAEVAVVAPVARDVESSSSLSPACDCDCDCEPADDAMRARTSSSSWIVAPLVSGIQT